MSEIIFPVKINQVNKNDLKIFHLKALSFLRKIVHLMLSLSTPYGGGRPVIGISSYENLGHLLRSIKIASGSPHFDYQNNKINGVLFLFFDKNEGFLLPDIEIFCKLGFNGIHDWSGYHIGYKMLDAFENLTMSNDEGKTFVGDYPLDLSAGKQLIFIYVSYKNI